MMNIQDILHILVCSLISDMYRIIDAKDCTYNYYCQLFTPVFWFLLWVFNNHADVSMLHNFIYYSRKYCISSANQSHWYPTIIVDHAHIIEVLFFIIHNAVCIFLILSYFCRHILLSKHHFSSLSTGMVSLCLGLVSLSILAEGFKVARSQLLKVAMSRRTGCTKYEVPERSPLLMSQSFLGRRNEKLLYKRR